MRHNTEPYSFITFAIFTLLTDALSCGRFHLCVWWWLKEKAAIVLCGPQACFELRRVSQWRAGGRLNVRLTWPRSHSLMQACVWPLSLSPSNFVCLYPSVSSFSLCLRCTCHLVWLHICGYPVYKAWTEQCSLCSGSLRKAALCTLRHLLWLKSIYPCKGPVH